MSAPAQQRSLGRRPRDADAILVPAARDLVRAGRHVVTTPAELIDIDTPEDLDRLRAIAEAPDQHDAITLPQPEPWWHPRPE